MKKILLLSALISFTIFTACNNQETENELVPAVQESTSLSENNESTDNGYKEPGEINFTINNEDNTVFEKDLLLLTNNSLNAVSYKWDFGNGDTSTEAHPSYKYEIHGLYTVTLTIVDANNKIHQESNEILVLCVFGGGVHNQ